MDACVVVVWLVVGRSIARIVEWMFGCTLRRVCGLVLLVSLLICRLVSWLILVCWLLVGWMVGWMRSDGLMQMKNGCVDSQICCLVNRT